MRIALAIMSLELGGGAEHDVVNLSTGLRKAGHAPVVVTSGGRLCADLQAEGITIAICPLWARTPMKLLGNADRLAGIIEDHDIEVFNPQGVYPAVSGRIATRRLARKGRIVPNVVTIHMLQRLKWWYYKLGSWGINWSADHVIVESRCELERLRKGGMTRPTTILHNCFPPKKYQGDPRPRQDIRREMGWPQDRVVFIMPARMTDEKGHDMLFQAINRPEVRKLPALFYLAGDGVLLEQHKRAARDLHLDDSVIFGGFRRDLPSLYQAADVFLLCSRRESLPLSIREGMGALLPVLSTNVGGICEAVENGANGILVPPDDPDALADAIVAMATDADMRERMGRRGLEISRQKFDYDNWITKTAELMDHVRQEMLAGRK